MGSERRRCVAVLGAGMRERIGEDGLARLVAAHPRVAVELVDPVVVTPDLFAATDAAVLLSLDAVRPLSAALGRGGGGRLRWVHWGPAGADGLLTPEVLAAAGVVLTASKGPLGAAIAEHALALLLALDRQLPAHLRNQAAARWAPLPAVRPPVLGLAGRTIAILGVGAIGGQLARMCRAGLGMRVLGVTRTSRGCPDVDRYVAPADLHGALAEADAVALALPATAATERLLDAAALAAMKPTAYLVNVARGAVVDEAALVAALRAGRLAGAGLDVFATEPLPPDHPLWTLPNVIVTPHTANRDAGVAQRFTDFIRDNIRRFGEGEPLLGQIDRLAGY
jgi:phosphoglycerate dehydrogenase-like enzyme